MNRILGKIFLPAAVCFNFLSCSSTFNSSGTYLEPEKYYTTAIPVKKNLVYVAVRNDTLRIYNYDHNEEKFNQYPVLIDRTNFSPSFEKVSFYRPSFDIDFLVSPLKLRSTTSSLPRHVSSSFNANIYLGYRNDIYKLRNNSIKNWKISIGGFAGIGSEQINPWSTNQNVAIEYDGVVFTTGAAVLIGIQKISTGVAVGVDYLMDRNKKLLDSPGKPMDWVSAKFGS